MFGWMSSTDLHPLLVSCIFHYEFEFIHPFADGNGRTSCLWHTLLLSHWRSPLAWLPIESVIRGRQADYYAAIASSNTAGTSDSFVTFMLTIIRDALIPYASDSPAQDRQERTLSFFKADPSATTIADLAGHLECAHRTAERIVSDLRRSGRLRREGSARAGTWCVIEEGGSA